MTKKKTFNSADKTAIENFKVMVRSFYPNAVFDRDEIVNDGSVSLAWLYGYDPKTNQMGMHCGTAMMIQNQHGCCYCVSEYHDYKSWGTASRTWNKKRFLTALKKVSEIDWPKLCGSVQTDSINRARGLSDELINKSGETK